MNYQSETEQIQTISRALIAFYSQRWLEWGQPYDWQLLNHLHVIEFRASDCDTGEMFEAFVKANEALERKAYGSGQHHFGIGYLAKRPGRESGLIRALVMVEPDHTQALKAAAMELPITTASVNVTSCGIDPCDPDAQWRWLAEGVIASTAMFEDSEPRFIMLGAKRSATAHLGWIPRRSNDCSSASGEINLLAIS